VENDCTSTYCRAVASCFVRVTGTEAVFRCLDEYR
jgi:hypothetical protein